MFQKMQKIWSVRNSPLFNVQWYLHYYNLPKMNATQAAKHYLEIGWKKGSNPSIQFDGNQYLKENPDVAKANICPLYHYERNGKAEGRKIYSNEGDFVFSPTPPRIFDKIVCSYKKHNPKISVIVTSYNYGQYINYTLDSIVSQTYINYEVIIVDDGSSDHSVDIITEYVKKHPNFFFYTHEQSKNKGLPETLQLAVGKARGDYIAFCESDDYWTKDHLAEKVTIINTYANPYLIVNDVELVGDFMRVTKMQNAVNSLRKFFSQTKNKVSYEMMRETNYILTFSCCMVKSSALKKCDFLQNPRPSATDWWLYRQIIKKHEWIFYSPKRLTSWRMHESYNTSQGMDIKIRQPIFDQKSDKLCNFQQKKITDDKSFLKIKHSPLFDADWYFKTYLANDHTIDPVAHYLHLGWKEQCNPSLKFNGNLYLSYHRDAYLSDMNPLLHYEMFGDGEQPFVIESKFQDLDILLITSSQEGDGVYTWRGEFLRDALSHYSVALESSAKLSANFLSELYYAKLIIFNHPNLINAEHQSIIRCCLKFNKTFFIDVDDLFLTQYAAYSGRYRSGNIDYDTLFSNLASQSASFVFAKRMIVSTKYLQRVTEEEYGISCIIYQNLIPRRFIRPKPPKTINKFRLLYASSSIAHDNDLPHIVVDLINFLLKYSKEVSLTIIGHSQFPTGFHSLNENIYWKTYKSFDEMLEIYSCHDLLLVPLEDNPFNNAKSNIRYIEAGAVGLPVLAYVCDEFKTTIQDGINGFLYENNFFERLESIYANRKVLPQVGLNAQTDVWNNWSTKSEKIALLDVLQGELC